MEQNSEKKFYITTAIIYANANPHIGHAYEFVLADAFARYQKQKGARSFLLTGIDEHGAKNAQSAKAANVEPQKFVDEKARVVKELDEILNVAYDDFVRTSDKSHHFPGAQMLWSKLSASGDIYKKKYKGLYCVGCEKFVTDKDLVGGKCPDHNTVPEELEEENYFFKLSKYTEEIKKKINAGEMKVTPASAKNEILALLEEGLEDVSFSRQASKLPWGIPVPEDPEQVMYVWCDALSNYITALGYGQTLKAGEEDKMKIFWPADVHLIGKDILRFHAALWPGMLLSAGLPLPKEILVHGFLTVDGKKMSKTIGNVVDPKEYALKYGTDALRYYFGREVTPFADGDFSHIKFLESYNANLANGLGNFISRVLKMTNEYFGGKIHNKNGEEPLVKSLIMTEIKPEFEKRMDAFEINIAYDAVWKLISYLDKHVNDTEPYKMHKTDKEKAEVVLFNLLYGLYFVKEMIRPIMPQTADIIEDLIGAEVKEGEPIKFETKALRAPLFARIG